MKKIILMSLMMALAMSFMAAAVTSDYYVAEKINISSHLTNPQAFEALPGGYVIIDWVGASSIAYKLDGQGILFNTTNSSKPTFWNLTLNYTSQKIEGVRNFNTTSGSTMLLLMGEKNISLGNLTEFGRNLEWYAPSPESFSTDDDLSGICTNGSAIWVAIKNRARIEFLNGTNSSVNHTGVNNIEIPTPHTSRAGAIDCSGNFSEIHIMDDMTGELFITNRENQSRDIINLTNLTGMPGNDKLTDISVISTFDFWVISNFTKTAYHILQRKNLETINPNITFTYPGRQLTINSVSHHVEVPFNFSVAVSNESFSSSIIRINCSVFINQTYNTYTFSINNISANTTLNISFPPGTYLAQIACTDNLTSTKDIYSGFNLFKVGTYKTLFWMNDTQALYYNSNSAAFELKWGNDTAILSAPYNITADVPVNIKVTWDNTTRNRTIFIDGIYAASDLRYNIKHTERQSRIYFGSNNQSGQINGVISYFQTTNRASVPTFRKGEYKSSWTSGVKDLSSFRAGYFFQFRAILRRSLTSERPVLKFVNMSFDNTIFNYSQVSSNLDFKFASATSSAWPDLQTDTKPFYTFWNTGNVSFSLQFYSLTPFDGCFNAAFFNISNNTRPGVVGNTLNLSTNPKNFTTDLGPGKNISVWLNVTATDCS